MVKFFNKLKRSTIIFFILFIMFLVAGFNYIKPLIDAGVIKNAVSVTDGSVLSENEGNCIVASGKLRIDNCPSDKETGIEVNGFALIKKVEVYQYAISDDGNVVKDYYAYQLNDIEGEGGEKYENPTFPSELKQETTLADVSIGNGELVLSEDYTATLCSDYEYIDADTFYVNDLPEIDNEYGLSPKSYGGFTAYYSGDPESPKIGDIRVKYEYIPESEISEVTAFGIQNEGKLVTDNEPYSCMSEGILTSNELYNKVMEEALSSAGGFIFVAIIFLILTVVSYLRGVGKTHINKAVSITTVISLLMIICMPTLCKADFGDYGGDNDYGGYDSYDSYDSNDSYDYGDSDTGGGFIFFDDDSDETTSGYYEYTDSDGDLYVSGITYLDTSGSIIDNVNVLSSVEQSNDSISALVSSVWSFGFFLIIAVLIIKRKGKSDNRNNRPAGAARTDTSTLTDINQYNNIDENFSLTDFKNNVSDLYVKLQNSWQEKNIEDLRPYLTDSFYAQCERQLNNYLRNKQTNIISDITVENVDVKGFKQDEENDYIVLELTAKIKDYVIDDNTGNVIRGNGNSFKRMQYEWTVLRAKGKKTGASITENAVCPHCGAPLTLNATSRCEYCDSIITSEASDWALKEIRGLSQTTLN